MTAPHWVAIVEGGAVVESGYCYCPDEHAAEHAPGTGMPR